MLTRSGRRIVWAASLAALALDLWLLVLPIVLHETRATVHQVLVGAVLIGIPVLQVALAQCAPAWAPVKWILISVSVCWFAASVLFMFEASLVFLPSGGLWIAGAVDTPKPSARL